MPPKRTGRDKRAPPKIIPEVLPPEEEQSQSHEDTEAAGTSGTELEGERPEDAESPTRAGARPRRKRSRASKKDIPEYQWTPEATMALADYVKVHPQLYDKRHRDWLNVVAKHALWVEIGQTLEPPATGECYSETVSILN